MKCWPFEYVWWLVWMNIMPVCQWNWICEDLFHNFVPLYFKKFACFDQFSKIRFLGPHFCWQRSPLGPHLTQNRVPIGSPFWTKLGPRGKWEQWFWFLLRNAAFYLKFTKNILWSTRLKSSHQIITPVKTPLHSFAFSLHGVTPFLQDTFTFNMCYIDILYSTFFADILWHRSWNKVCWLYIPV